MKSKFILLIAMLVFLIKINGQNNRLNTYENIGWCNIFSSIKLSNKFGIHSEYQWRRANFMDDWQQSLLRTGINYQLNPRVLIRLGYAWAETYPYGEITINSFGKQFTEHRIFQMIQLSQKEGIIDISHRFMLEQRFVGKYAAANLDKEDDFPLLNRMRYMMRFQLPLKGKEIANKTPYFACYDEVFIGFGKNVNANVFDQNRIGVLLGYRFNSKLRLEAGYINQIVQFGRQINGKNVFQNNSGFILNLNINIDATKKEQESTAQKT
jgi:hypothetical protein